VTAVVVLGLLQGLFFLGVGILVVVVAAEPEAQEALEADAGVVLVVGVTLALLGLIGCALAFLLARGSEFARSAYGILNVLHVGGSIFTLVAVREVAFGSVWSLLLAVTVLWCLYGSDTAAAYFDR